MEATDRGDHTSDTAIENIFLCKNKKGQNRKDLNAQTGESLTLFLQLWNSRTQYSDKNILFFTILISFHKFITYLTWLIFMKAREEKPNCDFWKLYIGIKGYREEETFFA